MRDLPPSLGGSTPIPINNLGPVVEVPAEVKIIRETILTKFVDYRCSATGVSSNVHFMHFIPTVEADLSTGPNQFEFAVNYDTSAFAANVIFIFRGRVSVQGSLDQLPSLCDEFYEVVQGAKSSGGIFLDHNEF